MTAANASSINDGASAMVLMRKSDASAGGHKILAEIVAHGAHAHEPAYFTTAPVKAIEKALARAAGPRMRLISGKSTRLLPWCR